MYLLLAYDDYYPMPNNIKGVYSTEEEAEDALVRYLGKNAGHMDNVEINYQEIGDNF